MVSVPTSLMSPRALTQASTTDDEGSSEECRWPTICGWGGGCSRVHTHTDPLYHGHGGLQPGIVHRGQVGELHHAKLRVGVDVDVGVGVGVCV